VRRQRWRLGEKCTGRPGVVATGMSERSKLVAALVDGLLLLPKCDGLLTWFALVVEDSRALVDIWAPFSSTVAISTVCRMLLRLGACARLAVFYSAREEVDNKVGASTVVDTFSD